MTSVIRCFPTIKDKVNYQDREKVETRPYGLIKCFAEKEVSFSYKSTFSSIFRTKIHKKIFSRIKFYYVSSGSGCCIIDYAPLTLKKNTVRSFEQHCLPVLT